MTFQVSTLSQKSCHHTNYRYTFIEYPQLEFVGMNPEESFHAIIQQILKQHPEADAIIHTGDLAQAPTPITYKRYINFMQTLGLPFSRPSAIMTMSTTFLYITKTINNL